MKNPLLFFGLLLSATVLAQSPSTASSPCAGVKGWRDAICKFARAHLVHFAWGYEHGIRDYQLAMKLAREEGVKVDEEVLFAAGLLHDMGGFPPYEKQGVDHAVRTTQVIDPVLREAGFPMEKAEAVKKAVVTHSYYDPTPPQTPEAVVLHDADTLDFMGAISIARLIAISGKERGFPDPKSATRLLTKFQAELPGKLYGGAYTRELGHRRASEMRSFLDAIGEQTFGLGLPLH
jgi:HD superfamily phosphodiesterase